MPVMFSVPQYFAEATSGEVVTGYNIQSSAPVVGAPSLPGTWTNVTGSPFASNQNIFDPNGTVSTYYRVQPVRQVTVSSTVYTLDTAWSRAFLPSAALYDMQMTAVLLPKLRFTYLNDAGVSQTNGTVLTETTGAGVGLWQFDGTTTRYNAQYVMNDDPVKILDNMYMMTYLSNGTTPKQMLADIDYTVDTRAGRITFATPPSPGDYCRFDFMKCDFVNEDLLKALASALNSLSHFGKSGYQMVPQYNLWNINQEIETPDLGDIICRLAVFLMREGQTEYALRSSMNWRDGQAGTDPTPSRGLEFLVSKLQISEPMIRRALNNYTRTYSRPRGRGEFEVFWDLTQLTPLSSGMFTGLPGAVYGGSYGAGIGGPFFPWYV